MSQTINAAHRRFEREIERAERIKNRKVLLIDQVYLDETPNPTINDFRSLRKIYITQNSQFHLERINKELGNIGCESEDDMIACTTSISSLEFQSIFKKEIRKCNKLYTQQKYDKCMDNLFAIIIGLRDFSHGLIDTEEPEKTQRILNNIAKIFKNIIHSNYYTLGLENENSKKLLYEILNEIKSEMEDQDYTFNFGRYVAALPNHNSDDDDDNDDDGDNNDNQAPHHSSNTSQNRNRNNQAQINNRRRVRSRNEMENEMKENTNLNVREPVRQRRRLNQNENEENDLLDYCAPLKESRTYNCGLFNFDDEYLPENQIIIRDRIKKLKLLLFQNKYDAFEPKIPNGIDWESLKVAELKEYLKKYSFKTTGKKKDLIYRLKNSKQYIVSMKKDYHKHILLKKLKAGENISDAEYLFDERKYVFDSVSGGRIMQLHRAKICLLTMCTPCSEYTGSLAEKVMNLLMQTNVKEWVSNPVIVDFVIRLASNS